MKKLWFLPLVLLVIASLVLGGCGEPEKTTQPSTQPTTQPTTPPTTSEGPKYGGVFKIITTEGFFNIGDPRQGGPPYSTSIRTIFLETLLRFSDAQENFSEIVPWLCKEWKYNDDLTTLTLKFEEGVKYHDGTDFNAQSVKECWELYIDGGLTQLSTVASMEVIDTYTLQLNLNQFDVGLVGLLAQSPIGQMVSPTAMKTYSMDEMINTPVGTGPFKLVEYDPGVKIVSEAFEDYWVEGLPYVDGIECDYIAESTVAKIAFERGEGDAIPRMDVKEARELMDAGYDVFISPAGFEFMLGGDIANEDSYFADINVRKAIAYAVDVEKIVDELGYGLWQINRRWWNPAHWANNPDPSPYYYDLDKAKELMAASNYADGFDTTIYMRDITYEDAILVIQQNIKAIGVNADIVVMTDAEQAAQAVEGWHNSIRHLLGPTSAEREPSVTSLTYYTEGNIYNASCMLPDDIIALLEEARGEADMEKRKELCQEAERLAMDEYCLWWNFVMVPFCVPKQSYVRDDNLRFFVGHYWTPEKVWLDK
jgi:peptide/nickel transport system substrate-binding protein